MNIAMKIVAVCGLCLIATVVVAEERINLTVPDQVRAGTTSYRISEFNMNWIQGHISIELLGENGEIKTVQYRDVDVVTEIDGEFVTTVDRQGRALMVAMNTMDFSSVSLNRRIMNRLLADGHLVGAVSGVPDTE